MPELNSYFFIILASVVIILSYLFNVLSKRTNIPSVLLLIVTGIGIKQGVVWFGYGNLDFFPVLEILGIVGLIMIVLEATLELELSKEKWPIIWKSFSIAALGLVLTAIGCAALIRFFMPEIGYTLALLYATPLSILSSAIVIPSVGNLVAHKKEFHVYESTFSDILGIMLFYGILGQLETAGAGNPVTTFFGNFFITVVIGLAASYGLIYVFQNIRSNVKLFLLIAILLLLYAIGKLAHLSSLIIIFVFGLVMSNDRIFFQGFLKKLVNRDVLHQVREDFHVVTIESSFVLRTFFFVIFGVSISLSSLWNVQVVIVSASMLVLIYVLRYLLFKLFYRTDIQPQVSIAPRGLITVLLFFAIPAEFQVPGFDSGILLFVIIISSLVMTGALIRSGNQTPDAAAESTPVEEEEEGQEVSAEHTEAPEAQASDEEPSTEPEDDTPPPPLDMSG